VAVQAVAVRVAGAYNETKAICGRCFDPEMTSRTANDRRADAREDGRLARDSPFLQITLKSLQVLWKR
jgi:hypothetical protein